MGRDRGTVAQSQQADSSRGLAVDAQGGPVFDPSKNVLDLVEAAIKRQDDLRSASERLAAEQLKYVIQRQDDLREAYEKFMNQAIAHRGEITDLFAQFAKEVRQVDVLAVKTEADRVLVAVQTLAAQTATDREKLRTDVATTAQAVAKQTADDRQQIIEQIAALQKSSYEGAGKEKVSDPMLAQMVNELKAMRTDISTSKGKETVTDPLVAQMALQLQALHTAVTTSGGEKAGIDKTWAMIMALGAGGGGAALMALLGK